MCRPIDLDCVLKLYFSVSDEIFDFQCQDAGDLKL